MRAGLSVGEGYGVSVFGNSERVRGVGAADCGVGGLGGGGGGVFNKRVGGEFVVV